MQSQTRALSIDRSSMSRAGAAVDHLLSGRTLPHLPPLWPAGRSSRARLWHDLAHASVATGQRNSKPAASRSARLQCRARMQSRRPVRCCCQVGRLSTKTMLPDAGLGELERVGIVGCQGAFNDGRLFAWGQSSRSGALSSHMPQPSPRRFARHRRAPSCADQLGGAAAAGEAWRGR